MVCAEFGTERRFLDPLRVGVGVYAEFGAVVGEGEGAGNERGFSSSVIRRLGFGFRNFSCGARCYQFLFDRVLSGISLWKSAPQDLPLEQVHSL